MDIAYILAFGGLIILFIYGWNKEHRVKKTFNTKTLDDVSGLNGTNIDKIFQVHCASDVLNVIDLAKKNNRQVSIFGSLHCQGGHAIVKDGYIIDTKYFNHVNSIDIKNKTITIEPGLIWSDLIKIVNKYGLSPKILQSYSTFSIGGTLSVNAHGITSDFGMYESVESLVIVTSECKKIKCSRTENKELFSLVIGGYGLFGIIVQVTLYLVDNKVLQLQSKSYNLDTFKKAYLEAMENKNVNIRLGRINISDFNDFNMYTFLENPAENKNVISKLDDSPKNISIMAKLIYKWCGSNKTFQKIRFWLEKYKGHPLDWQNKYYDRNQLLYESADSIAKLYEPIICINRTHILQEYFVSNDNFESFACYLKHIFSCKYTYLQLLNITIRYVKKDNLTFLPYATNDMFGFVLYFRMRRTQEADHELQEIHNKLTEMVLKLGGTYYLPYRHHYSFAQLEKAYPNIKLFANKKAFYDHDNMFVNLWYEKYLGSIKVANNIETKKEIIYYEEKEPFLLRNPKAIYKDIFNDEIQKHKFQLFLKYVLNILPYEKVMKLIEDKYTNSNGKDVTDDDIFKMISEFSHKQNKLKYISKTIKNLNLQKAELAKQTQSLLHECDNNKKFNGFVAIGDPGRYINKLKQKINIKGPIYILHDKKQASDVIERGTLKSPGQFMKINYDKIECHDITIAENSVDMVTCYIGLHHFDKESLHNLLTIIRKILRPNGVFIVREHNCYGKLQNIVTAAHHIYNAITKQPITEEHKEYRHFRSLNEWSNILDKYDLIDNNKYQLQKHDPTENYLICLTNNKKNHDEIPAKIKNIVNVRNTYKRPLDQTYQTLPEWYSVDIVREYGHFMTSVPWYKYPYLKVLSTFWKLFFKETKISFNRMGWKAFTSSYIIMNSVIGTLIMIVFVQLQILAIPLLILYGLPGNQEPERIELICKTAKKIDFSTINDKIKVISKWDNFDDNYHYSLLEIPRYKPFTQIMLQFAERNIIACEIAGNTKIQIKVSMMDKKLLEAIKTSGICKILFDFISPSTQHIQVAVEVSTSQIGELVKLCHINGITVDHIFDY
ncbi:MAG: oxidoreductase FAD-binding [Edafosvirus sp.]|uniref:Oxidoreductase FAD-binding n=1 Tax=Edafosvirus sp. TaxID=2487765 RepID=A0A3G4ZS73_9VIRU|nr:MAG: oxidoreductase FAD-binding [Edafosvirus sp.]